MIELIATACAGVFAGAAIYISAVQHPAALRTGTGFAAAFFPRMYRRAAPMQATLAVVGTAAGLHVSRSGGDAVWLIGALLLGFVVPFTLLVMKGVNARLRAEDLDPADPAVACLLRRWGRLHAARSVSSALAFLAFLAGWTRP